MKIGVFGGSFNPPHNMHYNIAKCLINERYVDKIIFVPTGTKYKYKNNLINDEYRLEMLSLMTNDCQNMDICDYELKDYNVHTCETLAYFKSVYPNDEIYFVCGVDNLSYIDKWENGLDILGNYKILVIDRDTHNIDDLLKKFNEYLDNIIVVPIALSDISSTKIRELISERKYDEVDELISPKVLKYIRKENLYENI